MATGVSFGGTAQFILNGQLVTLSGQLKAGLGGIQRTPAVGPDGPTGNWIEKWVAPQFDFEMWDDPTVSLTDLFSITGQTVQIAGRNGKTYMLYGAFFVDPPDPDVVAGKVTAKMSGKMALEIVV